MSECLQDSDFERFYAEVLDEPEQARIRRHLDQCDACRARTEAFRTENQDLFGKLREAMQPAPEMSSGPDQPTRREERNHKPPAALPGVTIEGYEIIRELGRGGMGIVYEAHQVKLNRKVALKVLPALPGAINREAVDRFRHEATAAGKLHHTNIVPIYDFGQSGHLYYYAMELVEGRPLSEMIRRFAEANAVTASPTDLAELLHMTSAAQAETLAASDDRPPSTRSGSSRSGSGTTGHGRIYFRQVAHWMADAADALHYAHSQRIIHRDIKPGNLLLSNDGRIMVLDFGLAKSATDISFTQTGSLLGTLRYMSPEQAMAKRMNVDHRTDIYSLGATMYELLTFQPPFRGSDDKEILGQIITREPTPLRKIIPHLPRELETICLKTLEKDAGRRYATAAGLADDLRRYSQDLPIVARPVGAVGRAMKFVRRRKALSVAILAITLLALTAAMAYRSSERAKREQAHRYEAQKRERLERLEKHLTEGVRCIQAQDWADAEKALGEVLLLDPDNYRALVNLATAKRSMYEQDKDPAMLEGALALVDRAIQSTPDGFHAWNLKGVLLRLLGRLEAAAEAHRRASEINPNYYPNWVSLANVQSILGQVDESENSLMKATALPDAANVFMAWHNLLAIQIHLGKPEAMETLKKLPSDPNHQLDLLLLKARFHLQFPGHIDAGKALSAMIAAEELARPNHTDARIKRFLALAHLRNADWAAAADAASQAIDRGAEATYLRLILAVAEAKLGNLSAARESVDLAVASWPAELEEKAVIATADRGLLWFETIAERKNLRAEAVAAIAAGGS